MFHVHSYSSGMMGSCGGGGNEGSRSFPPPPAGVSDDGGGGGGGSCGGATAVHTLRMRLRKRSATKVVRRIAQASMFGGARTMQRQQQFGWLNLGRWVAVAVGCMVDHLLRVILATMHSRAHISHDRYVGNPSLSFQSIQTPLARASAQTLPRFRSVSASTTSSAAPPRPLGRLI